jgi:hypothetical protein
MMPMANKDKLIATMAATASTKADHGKASSLIKLKYVFGLGDFERISS